MEHSRGLGAAGRSVLHDGLLTDAARGLNMGALLPIQKGR